MLNKTLDSCNIEKSCAKLHKTGKKEKKNGKNKQK